MGSRLLSACSFKCHLFVSPTVLGGTDTVPFVHLKETGPMGGRGVSGSLNLRLGSFKELPLPAPRSRGAGQEPAAPSGIAPARPLSCSLRRVANAKSKRKTVRRLDLDISHGLRSGLENEWDRQRVELHSARLRRAPRTAGRLGGNADGGAVGEGWRRSGLGMSAQQSGKWRNGSEGP